MSGITLKETDPDAIPTPASGKSTVFMDADTSEPAYKDEADVVHSLKGEDGELSYQDHGNTGSSETVDASTNVHRLVLNAATVTLTITGAPASGTPGIVRLRLVGDGSTTAAIVWPGSVDFGDPGEPDLLVDGTVIVDLETEDGGTTWIGTQAGRPGPAGADGTNGADGAVGGAIAIPYVFSTTTTDSDPGNGNLRLSNATQNAATVIRADLLDSLGATVTGVLDSFADTDNAILGDIRLFKTDDPSKWLTFEVSAVASPSGYRNITVANTGSSASSPFSNGDAITMAFSRSGDQGSTVGSGTVTTVEEVDGSPTDSAVTTIKFPNATLGISSHVATYTPAPVPGRLLGYNACTSGNYTPNSATMGDADATNMAVTFTAPASGNVLVRLSAICSADHNSPTSYQSWGLRESTSNIAGAAGESIAVRDSGATNDTYNSATIAFVLTGISAGSHTYKWAFAQSAGTGNLKANSSAPAVMEVVELP